MTSKRWKTKWTIWPPICRQSQSLAPTYLTPYKMAENRSLNFQEFTLCWKRYGSHHINLYPVELRCILFIPPANFVCGGYTVFTLSVRACVCVCVRASVCASVRPSVTFCFLNILKSHCWIFIKPCKHVHICKTNTLDKKVRARGQFY